MALDIGTVVGFTVARMSPWVSGAITGLGAAGLSLAVLASSIGHDDGLQHK